MFEWRGLHVCLWQELVKHCLFVSDEGCIWWKNLSLVGVVCYYSNCHYDIWRYYYYDITNAQWVTCLRKCCHSDLLSIKWGAPRSVSEQYFRRADTMTLYLEGRYYKGRAPALLWSVFVHVLISNKWIIIKHGNEKPVKFEFYSGPWSRHTRVFGLSKPFCVTHSLLSRGWQI